MRSRLWLSSHLSLLHPAPQYYDTYSPLDNAQELDFLLTETFRIWKGTAHGMVLKAAHRTTIRTTSSASPRGAEGPRAVLSYISIPLAVNSRLAFRDREDSSTISPAARPTSGCYRSDA